LRGRLFFAFDEFTRYNLAGDEKGRGQMIPKKDLMMFGRKSRDFSHGMDRPL